MELLFLIQLPIRPRLTDQCVDEEAPSNRRALCVSSESGLGIVLNIFEEVAELDSNPSTWQFKQKSRIYLTGRLVQENSPRKTFDVPLAQKALLPL